MAEAFVEASWAGVVASMRLGFGFMGHDLQRLVGTDHDPFISMVEIDPRRLMSDTGVCSVVCGIDLAVIRADKLSRTVPLRVQGKQNLICSIRCCTAHGRRMQ